MPRLSLSLLCESCSLLPLPRHQSHPSALKSTARACQHGGDEQTDTACADSSFPMLHLPTSYFPDSPHSLLLACSTTFHLPSFFIHLPLHPFLLFSVYSLCYSSFASRVRRFPRVVVLPSSRCHRVPAAQAPPCTATTDEHSLTLLGDHLLHAVSACEVGRGQHNHKHSTSFRVPLPGDHEMPGGGQADLLRNRAKATM